ncbi:MAG TPA: molecular chaperone TorD family protein [Burkholderiaceae bacterium]|nr:molecular chaperone TorD family protein [Burkholderiaceae bacterium]
MNAPAELSRPDAVVTPEDQARANWYLFLARLFRAPPDDQTLQSLRSAALDEAVPEPSSPLLHAWNELLLAAQRADAQRVRVEYDEAFIGVGKSEVTLNASWYLTGFLHERPLAELRERLAALGLARREGIAETEDHIASLCEVMAWLITRGDQRVEAIDVQREFFQRFLAPWYERLADALQASATVDFYRPAGRVLREFLEVERQAFDFDS